MHVESTRRVPRIMFHTSRARLAATCRFKTSLILARADASKVLCGQFRSTAFKDLLSASSKNVAPMRGFPCQAALWLMATHYVTASNNKMNNAQYAFTMPLDGTDVCVSNN